MENKPNYLLVLPALVVLSIFVGALGGHTVHYQCKYVTGVTTEVPDTTKYGTALYTIKYSDGSVGTTSEVDNDGPAGLSKGTACRTVFNYGFPYQWTNRNIKDESLVK